MLYRGRSRMLGSCSNTICSISSTQHPSLNLELPWQPENPNSLSVSVPYSVGVTDMWSVSVLGIQTQICISYTPSHLSSPSPSSTMLMVQRLVQGPGTNHRVWWLRGQTRAGWDSPQGHSNMASHFPIPHPLPCAGVSWEHLPWILWIPKISTSATRSCLSG